MNIVPDRELSWATMARRAKKYKGCQGYQDYQIYSDNENQNRKKIFYKCKNHYFYIMNSNIINKSKNFQSSKILTNAYLHNKKSILAYTNQNLPLFSTSPKEQQQQQKHSNS